MIPYLLLYLHAKFEDQEAMGSRQARELNLLTKKIILIEDCRRSYKYRDRTQTYVKITE